MNNDETYTLEPFWPEERSVNSVFLEFGKALKLNSYNLTKARRGTLSRASPSTAKGLLALASSFAGRQVSLEEICSGCLSKLDTSENPDEANN
ncbi:MAG: hypothetical protein F6K42_25060 [Leptolyngbya sp. SIO1D8]|nr:hypothetical protein [Leptolyngbya sp. SIO1D8]